LKCPLSLVSRWWGPISVALIDGVGSLLLQVLIVIMGDEKAIISRTSGHADTRVGAMERDRRGLSIQPKIERNGAGTHPGQIRRSSKMGVMMTRE